MSFKLHKMTPVLLAALLLAAPLAAQSQAESVEAPMLQPGDRLELVIWRNPELSGVFTVATDGTLLHPLFSTMQVARVPISVARQRMAEYLQGYQADPHFVFQPQYRVYVGGLVGVQGQYHLAESTVAQAITLAGGSTAPNRRYRVRLIRDGVPTVANLDGSSETALLSTTIRSGDQILVEERPSFMRNYLNPSVQVLQTLTAFVATYVYLNAIFGSD